MSFTPRMPDYLDGHSHTTNINSQTNLEHQLVITKIEPKEANYDLKVPLKRISHMTGNIKLNLKKLYEVVRGMFTPEKMPLTRAKQIVNDGKFRKDETPEQRKLTLEWAKRKIEEAKEQENREKGLNRNPNKPFSASSHTFNRNSNLQKLLAKHRNAKRK